MVSKRKGNKINGWVTIDKPAAITSTGVVNKIKWAFISKKVGHIKNFTQLGTLSQALDGVWF